VLLVRGDCEVLPVLMLSLVLSLVLLLVPLLVPVLRGFYAIMVVLLSRLALPAVYCRKKMLWSFPVSVCEYRYMRNC